ncbi:MAG: TIGR03750 family conjugal transfer protein [Candidatus Obscuribacterales bacterium]|nr:TIGR03750 family conjugal transfer protein [Candidatus Obscuribacterales bacterium]
MNYASYLGSMTFGLFVCMIAGAVLLRKYARWKGIQPVNYEYADRRQQTRLEAISSMVYSAICDITTLNCSAEELRNTGMFWGGVVGLILGALTAWLTPAAAMIITAYVGLFCLVIFGKAAYKDVILRILPAIDALEHLQIGRRPAFAADQMVEVNTAEDGQEARWMPACVKEVPGPNRTNYGVMFDPTGREVHDYPASKVRAKQPATATAAT